MRLSPFLTEEAHEARKGKTVAGQALQPLCPRSPDSRDCLIQPLAARRPVLASSTQTPQFLLGGDGEPRTSHHGAVMPSGGHESLGGKPNQTEGLVPGLHLESQPAYGSPTTPGWGVGRGSMLHTASNFIPGHTFLLSPLSGNPP